MDKTKDEPTFPRWELVLMYHDRNGTTSQTTVISPEAVRLARVNPFHIAVDVAFENITKKIEGR